jgi:hypothetical protein
MIDHLSAVTSEAYNRELEIRKSLTQPSKG